MHLFYLCHFYNVANDNMAGPIKNVNNNSIIIEEKHLNGSIFINNNNKCILQA